MANTNHFAVILPAAGKSTRFGGPEKKAFLSIAGEPVWVYSARRFAECGDVRQILLVVADEDHAMVERQFSQELTRYRVTLASGGAERFDSVANALALVTDEVDFIAVHDAARPCINANLIDVVFQGARIHGAAILAVPVTDTIKRGNDALDVVETVPRQGLWLAQTPQVFRRDWLVAAYAQLSRLDPSITDDAQLVEVAGHTVHIVPGSPENLKITTADDWAFAEAILQSRR